MVSVDPILGSMLAYIQGVRDVVQQMWTAALHQQAQSETTAPKLRRTPRLTDMIAMAVDCLHSTSRDNPRAWGTAVMAERESDLLECRTRVPRTARS